MTDTNTAPMIRHARAKHILDYVAAHPDTTVEQYALDQGKPGMYFGGTFINLAASGKLVRQRRGHAYHYRLAKVSGVGAKAETTTNPKAIFTPDTYVQELEAKVAELEKWKAAAIERYPDLQPVDPMVLEARRIFAKYSADQTPATLANVRAGKLDETAGMRAIMEALQLKQKEQTDA